MFSIFRQRPSKTPVIWSFAPPDPAKSRLNQANPLEKGWPGTALTNNLSGLFSPPIHGLGMCRGFRGIAGDIAAELPKRDRLSAGLNRDDFGGRP